MNKVITVNLNGNAYQLEEGGYIALEDYLADAEAQLKDNPDLTEIMADLEQAIADKCNKHLTPNKNVVRESEIEQVLTEMGRVEPDAGEAAGDQSQQRTGARSVDSGAPKRLYRIREGAMIAGVCKGLAAYLNIDVTLIRLALGLGAIASAGVLVLAYFMAAIIIPPASTFEERAEAHGQPFNAQELVGQAKEYYSTFKKGAENWWRQTGSRDWIHFKRNVRKETDSAYRQACRAVRNAHWSFYASPEVDRALHVLTIVALPIFALIIAGLTVIWILAAISLVYTGAVFGWPLPVAVPLWVGILMLLALYAAVVGPFKMAFQGRGYYHGGRYYGWPGVLGGLVWLACVTLGFGFAYTYIPEVRDAVDNLPSILNHVVSLSK